MLTRGLAVVTALVLLAGAVAPAQSTYMPVSEVRPGMVGTGRTVFEGDTLYAQSEVIETRPARSRPAMGIVKLRTTGFNQDGTTVIEFLLGPGSSYVHGAQFFVDGGYDASSRPTQF